MAREEGADKSFSRQVNADFRAYWDKAEKSRIEDERELRPVVSSAYLFARCFSVLNRSMGAGEAHERIFLRELASDALHLVHALVGGDARGGRFYLRSVIENFWRHHYFRDHPVEYGWLHTRKKYYLDLKSLREHCLFLDCFQGRIKPLYGDLTKLYAELSTAVHSTSSRTLVLRDTVDDIRLSKVQGKSIVNDMRKVMRAVLALCIFSERPTFQAMHVNVQAGLLGTLTVRERGWLLLDIEDADRDLDEAGTVEEVVAAALDPQALNPQGQGEVAG